MGTSPTRAVVITGASTGIGEACALRLDRAGFTVFAGVRSAESGEQLRRQASDHLIPIMLDVTDEGSIERAAAVVAARLGDGGIAGLVNNAGIAVAGALEFVPIAKLREQLEVNVVGQIAVTRAFLPLLRKSGGRIVNMSSVSGRLAVPFIGPYSASKWALEALSDALRVELRPWKIHVALIEPGVIATPIWSKSLAAAERVIESLPPEAHVLYGPVTDFMRRRAASGAGIPADRVARAVAHALLARRPRTRYLVGTDARVGALLARLPDRLRDRLLARTLPRYGPALATEESSRG